MNFYSFHIGDYASATRHLSWDEDAAYRRLLDAYYTHEKPLPLELRAVIRLVMASTDAQREAVETVLKEFFERTDKGWVSKRAEAEILTMKSKQQKQREKANIRWQKPQPEPGNAAVIPRCQEADATASKTDADAAMPATLTREPRKRSAPPAQPADVDDQTWQDWQALRKAKNAPVTVTVIEQARTESAKAGMTLAAFLRIWCAKGSQGMQAEWISTKPHERAAPPQAESFRERDTRLAQERFDEAAGRRRRTPSVIDITPPAEFLETLQ